MFVALRDRDGSLEAAAVADAASPGTNGGAKGSSNPPLLEGNDCVMTKATGKTVAGSDKILGVNATAPPSPENVVSSLSPSFAPQKLSSISCSLPDAGGDQKREQHQQKEGLEASSVSCVLTRRLKAIHQRYGEFAEENGYVRCEDVQVRKGWVIGCPSVQILKWFSRNASFHPCLCDFLCVSANNLFR